jgi:protein disulfide-isomerase A6
MRFCAAAQGQKLTRSIAGLLSSPSLAPTKLDELKIKANILASFAAKKVEEFVEYVEEVGSDVEEAAEGAASAVKEKVGQATDRVKQEL